MNGGLKAISAGRCAEYGERIVSTPSTQFMHEYGESFGLLPQKAPRERVAHGLLPHETNVVGEQE